MGGAKLNFCKDELGMWRWLMSSGSGKSLFESREAFSNLDLCRKDALRELRELVLRGSATPSAAEEMSIRNSNEGEKECN